MAITLNGSSAAGAVTLTGTQTLTNKTLTNPTISDATFSGQQTGLEIAFNQSIVFEGTTADASELTLTAGEPTADRTVTLPNATTTLVGTDTTDTLTNKTLTSPTIGTQASFDNQAETRFLEATANGTNYVGFKAPASITTNLVWTLPSADGTANQVLSTDGSGVLSFATASSGGVSANDQAFAFAVQVFA
jgi:hypothetical protein